MMWCAVLSGGFGKKDGIKIYLQELHTKPLRFQRTLVGCGPPLGKYLASISVKHIVVKYCSVNM